MYRLPVGPIFRDDGGKHEPADEAGYLSLMREWRDGAVAEAIKQSQFNEEAQFVKRYTDFISGKHWPSNRPNFLSHFHTNRVGMARIGFLANLTDARPSIAVVPNIPQRNSGFGEREQAADIFANTIRAEWFRSRMSRHLMTAVDIAATCGTSFWKIGATGPGVMRVTPCGPESVLPIQPGLSIQSSTAVVYRTWKSLAEIQARFGERAAGLEKEVASMIPVGANSLLKPNYMDQTVWNGLNPGFKRLLGRNTSTTAMTGQMFPSVEWQEIYIDDLRVNETPHPVTVRDKNSDPRQHNWWYVVQPGQRLYPRKRLVVYAGNNLMYDGPSPFWHGLYPFATMRLNPVFWSFYGLSLYRDLIPPNEAINHIVAGILDMIKKALNPPFIAKKNAVSDAAWRQFFPNIPGDKLLITKQDVNPSQDFRFLDPPQLPQYVFAILSQFLGPEFEKLSGQVDIQSLTNKKQVPGGDTLEQMRDNMQAPLRLMSGFIEDFLVDAGTQAISNIAQFYTAQKLFWMIGIDGVTWNSFDYDPQRLMVPSDDSKTSFWQQFQFMVTPGSVHSGSKDREKQTAIGLFSAGGIDRRAMLQTINFPNGDEIASRMEQREMEMAQAQAEAKSGGLRLTRGQRNGEVV